MATKTVTTIRNGVKTSCGKEVFVAQETIDYALDAALTGANLLATADVVEHVTVPAGHVVLGASLLVDRAPTGLTSPTITLKVGATAVTAAITPVTGTHFPSTTGTPAIAAAAAAAKCTLTFGGSGTVTNGGKYTVSLFLAQI